MDTMAKVLASRQCKHCGCDVVDHYKSKPWSCKPCIRTQAKAWRDANPNKCREYEKQRNPDAKYHYNIKKRYGISSVEYQQMLKVQNYSCAICKTKNPGNSNGVHTKFSVDHDHNTGAVRGLLCNNCNRGIGLLQDSPNILLQAHVYLSKK